MPFLLSDDVRATDISDNQLLSVKANCFLFDAVHHADYGKIINCVFTGESIIGRWRPTCQIVLPLHERSRKHCSILIDKGEHFIMDLNSSHQTLR